MCNQNANIMIILRKAGGKGGRTEVNGKVHRGKKFHRLKVNAAVPIISDPFSLLLSNTDAIITAG